MKTRLFMLMGILSIVSVIMIGPVAAATSGTAAVTGNPKSSVSITLNQSSIFLDLDPAASPATNTSLAIIVSTNTPFTITVKDSSGRASGLGYMGNYTTSYVANPLDTTLASALALSGTTNSSTTAASVTPPIDASGKTLYNGGQKTNTQYLFNTFSQDVSFDDTRLPTGSVYRIDLEFDITAV
jgi:hypothetical protein